MTSVYNRIKALGTRSKQTTKREIALESIERETGGSWSNSDQFDEEDPRADVFAPSGLAEYITMNANTKVQLAILLSLENDGGEWLRDYLDSQLSRP